MVSIVENVGSRDESENDVLRIKITVIVPVALVKGGIIRNAIVVFT